MKILISGGHPTPALAFIDFLDKLSPAPEIVFVGRLFSKTNNEQRSAEFDEVKRRNHRFVPLTSGKLSLLNPLSAVVQATLVIRGIAEAFVLIAREHPSVFVSFGGYLAVPLAIACWLWGVPIVTHEQTHSIGVANAIIGRLAKKIALSYEDTEHQAFAKKTVITGNLIRPMILQSSKTAPLWFGASRDYPVLYVTGGSQGSEIINTTIAQAIKQLTKQWIVIHQCGMRTTKRNYLAELENVRQSLPRAQQSRYIIREWIGENELAWIYTISTAIISRSGANTSEEIARRGIPAIFIPLPFSRHQEQLENARVLAAQKAALLIHQKQLSAQTLLEALEQLKAEYNAMKKRLRALTFIENPAKQLWQVVQSVSKK